MTTSPTLIRRYALLLCQLLAAFAVVTALILTGRGRSHPMTVNLSVYAAAALAAATGVRIAHDRWFAARFGDCDCDAAAHDWRTNVDDSAHALDCASRFPASPLSH